MRKNRKKGQCKASKAKCTVVTVKERTQYTSSLSLVCSSLMKSKNASMTTTTTNVSDAARYCQSNASVGDILLHCERTIAIVEVISQSSSASSSSASTVNKPDIPRLVTHPSSKTDPSKIVSCDLKNTNDVRVTHEPKKPSSSKAIKRVHNAGWALVKELKLKVGTTNPMGTKASIDNQNKDVEQTYF